MPRFQIAFYAAGISLISAVILAAAVAILLAVRRTRSKSSQPDVGSIVWNAVVAFTLIVIGSVTLVPTESDPTEHPGGEYLGTTIEPFSLSRFLIQAAGNIALFMPFGAALAIRQLSLLRTALLAFVLSSGIETAQFFFVTGRSASLTDVLLNVAGALLGHGLVAMTRRRSPH